MRVFMGIALLKIFRLLTLPGFQEMRKRNYLVITHTFLRRRASGLLDECTPQILRCAQDDSLSIVILSAAKDLLPTYG